MKSKNKHLSEKSWVLILAVLAFVHVYVIIFMAVARPCEHINRAFNQEYGLIILRHTPLYPVQNTPFYPSGTELCISENVEVNKYYYWFYWPIHQFMEWRGIVYFAYDPQLQYKESN